jgi:thymidylate kinase
MKIALIGAQGVGKTSLSKILAEERQAVVVPEVARDCPYPIDTKADFRTEWWMVAHSILAEKEASLQAGNQLLIADRCVLDIAVYSQLVHELDSQRLSAAHLQMIRDTIRTWLALEPYDMVFLLEVSESVWRTRDLDDGFRSLDFSWFQKLTAGFREATKLLPRGTGIRTILNDGTPEELRAKVARALTTT